MNDACHYGEPYWTERPAWHFWSFEPQMTVLYATTLEGAPEFLLERIDYLEKRCFARRK